VPLAVKVGDVATPVADVATVADVKPVPANVPLAPMDGAANVTESPMIGLPRESVTVAFNAEVNAWLTNPDWLLVMGTTVIDVAGPGLLVRLITVFAAPAVTAIE
jgi:hypothetical protein